MSIYVNGQHAEISELSAEQLQIAIWAIHNWNYLVEKGARKVAYPLTAHTRNAVKLVAKYWHKNTREVLRVGQYVIKHGYHGAVGTGPGKAVQATSMAHAVDLADYERHNTALSLGTQAGYWHQWVVRECFGQRRRRVLLLPSGKRWRNPK